MGIRDFRIKTPIQQPPISMRRPFPAQTIYRITFRTCRDPSSSAQFFWGLQEEDFVIARPSTTAPNQSP
jgi:hypothetical protein